MFYGVMMMLLSNRVIQ